MDENEQVTLIATDVSGERWISKPLSAIEASEIVKTVKLVFQEDAAGYMKFDTESGGTTIINIAHIVTVQITAKECHDKATLKDMDAWVNEDSGNRIKQRIDL